MVVRLVLEKAPYVLMYLHIVFHDYNIKQSSEAFLKYGLSVDIPEKLRKKANYSSRKTELNKLIKWEFCDMLHKDW